MKGQVSHATHAESERLDSKRGIFSRRKFVGGSVLVAASAALAACGPQNPTSAPAEKKEEKAASSSEKKSEYRIGMEAAYAPYNWQVDKESDTTIPIDNVPGAYADGYDVAIAKLVCEQMGASATAVKMQFSGLIDALKQGQIDLIIAGMSKTPERAESIDFSEPYYVGTYGLLVQKGSKYEGATSLEDFKGAAVLGQKDTLLDTVIDEIPGVNHLTPVDSVPNQIAHLEEGTCDAITYEAANMATILKSHAKLAGVTFEKGKGFKDEIYCNVGIAKGQDDLLKQVNDALATISDEKRSELYQDAMARQPE